MRGYQGDVMRFGNHVLLHVVAASLSLAMAASACGAEQPIARAADIRTGHGAGAWGVVPMPADSVTARFGDRPVPFWVHAVDLPYHVVGLPLRAFTAGLGQTIVFLDEKKVVYHIRKLISPRELPYGFVFSFSAGRLAGAGVGATFVHDEFFGPHNRLRLGYELSSAGHRRVRLGTLFAISDETELQLGAGYRLQPNARYFGIGPHVAGAEGSTETRESFYTQELTWVGLDYRRHLGADFYGHLKAMFTTIGARGPGDQKDPSLAEVYAGDLPTGFGQRSDGWYLGTSLQHDTETQTARPSSGGIRRLSATYFAPTDALDVPFWTYRLDLEQFIPLWYPTRVLALRAFYSWIDPTEGRGTSDVPFQRLMTNDDPDLLRGYEDYRFRDRGMALFTAEYRWPVWEDEAAHFLGIDAYLLTDIGQVFGRTRDISWDNMTVSYGIGLRLIRPAGFIGRLEYAHSEDDDVIRLRADQVFQFNKGDLFHGRNPVPTR